MLLQPLKNTGSFVRMAVGCHDGVFKFFLGNGAQQCVDFCVHDTIASADLTTLCPRLFPVCRRLVLMLLLSALMLLCQSGLSLCGFCTLSLGRVNLLG